MTKPEEWQLATSVSNTGTLREHIAHLVEPRFTGRFVRIDPFENQPITTEGGADLDSGFVFRIDGRTMLCELAWRDELPEAEDQAAFATHWVREAVKARHFLKANFLVWKALPPVRDMAERISLDIGKCQTWSDYTEVFCAENRRSDGKLVDSIRKLAGVVSTGEVPVLLGMLHAADYSRVADEIGGDDIWRRFDRTYGECAQAAALAIMRD